MCPDAFYIHAPKNDTTPCKAVINKARTHCPVNGFRIPPYGEPLESREPMNKYEAIMQININTQIGAPNQLVALKERERRLNAGFFYVIPGIRVERQGKSKAKVSLIYKNRKPSPLRSKPYVLWLAYVFGSNIELPSSVLVVTQFHREASIPAMTRLWSCRLMQEGAGLTDTTRAFDFDDNVHTLTPAIMYSEIRASCPVVLDTEHARMYDTLLEGSMSDDEYREKVIELKRWAVSQCVCGNMQSTLFDLM